MDPRPEEHDEEVERQVSRLLAEVARADEQRMPEDVAARLDDVLAGLVAERTEAPPHAERDVARQPSPEPRRPEQDAAGPPVEGPVPPEEVVGATALAARRRSWAPRLLVAAAAVSVIALGVGVGLDDLTGAGGGDSSLTSEGAAGGALPGEERQTGVDGSLDRQEEPGAASDQKPAPELTDGMPTTGESTDGSVRLRSRTLRADVQRVADAGVASRAPDLADHDLCVRPELGRADEWVAARLDGRSAVLVLRAPEGGLRAGEVFACGSPRSPVASTTVLVR